MPTALSIAAPLAPELFELEGRLWVMHCAEGPVPRPAAEAVSAFLSRETRPWTLRWQEDFQDLPAATREAGAQVLDARSEDLSLTATTSSGLVTVAQGLDWRPGDRVLLPDGEFPANVWPWKALEARGVTVQRVPLWDGHLAGARTWASTPPPPGIEPEERLLSALRWDTRVLAVSWVRFQDGLRLDLDRLAHGCRARGVHLVVDGIQGAGTSPLTLAPDCGIAAFASGGHKGLLAPQGLGFLWTDPAFRARLVPSGSWLSVADATDFDRPSTDFDRPWCEDGSRLEAGVPNLLGCAALEASLRPIADVGVPAIARHVRGLVGRLLEGLVSLPSWRGEARRLRALHDRDRLGAIVGLHHGGRGPGGLDTILRDGFERGIYASVREGYLRIALHGFHSEADVERLLAWLSRHGR